MARWFQTVYQLEKMNNLSSYYEFLVESERRISRKKGQPAGSEKHSDLYTDENPQGTIHGLGFKDSETANKSIGIIKKARVTHAHKVQATLVMVQRGKVAIERTKDPEKKKALGEANKIWAAFLEELKLETAKRSERGK